MINTDIFSAYDLLDFIPGISYPIYESKYFNQNINKFEDFRLLDKSCEKKMEILLLCHYIHIIRMKI